MGSEMCIRDRPWKRLGRIPGPGSFLGPTCSAGRVLGPRSDSCGQGRSVPVPSRLIAGHLGHFVRDGYPILSPVGPAVVEVATQGLKLKPPTLLGPRKAVRAGRGWAVRTGTRSPSRPSFLSPRTICPGRKSDPVSRGGRLRLVTPGMKPDTPRFCSVRVKRLEQAGVGLFGQAAGPVVPKSPAPGRHFVLICLSPLPARTKCLRS